MGVDIEDKISGVTLLEISLLQVEAEQGGEEYLLAVKTCAGVNTCHKLTPDTFALFVSSLALVTQNPEQSVMATQTNTIN